MVSSFSARASQVINRLVPTRGSVLDDSKIVIRSAITALLRSSSKDDKLASLCSEITSCSSRSLTAVAVFGTSDSPIALDLRSSVSDFSSIGERPPASASARLLHHAFHASVRFHNSASCNASANSFATGSPGKFSANRFISLWNTSSVFASRIPFVAFCRTSISRRCFRTESLRLNARSAASSKILVARFAPRGKFSFNLFRSITIDCNSVSDTSANCNFWTSISRSSMALTLVRMDSN